MRHIKDDAYLFSTANINRGEILAARCAKGGDARGERLFSVLDIERGDVDFFNECLSFGSENIVLLSGRGKSARAVLILRFFSYSSASCLAIVPEISPAALIALLDDGCTTDRRFSPAFLRAVDGIRASTAETEEAREYLYEMISLLRPLYGLKLQRELPDAYTVRRAIVGVARFVGVKLCRSAADGSGCDVFCERGSVYAGPLCCANIIAWAMEAREHSVDRVLTVGGVCSFFGHRIDFSYRSLSDRIPVSLSQLYGIALSVSADAKLELSCGLVSGSLTPTYLDVGLEEAKNHGGAESLYELELALYNYSDVYPQFD